MKYLLMLGMFLMTTQISAQTVKYTDGKIMYEGEELQTIDVLLSPKVSTIKDKFETWMDKHYDVDLAGKKLLFFDKEFMTANGVIIPQISEKKIDLKVKVAEVNDKDTRLHVFASYGYNNWITPEDHPQAFKALKVIVHDFVADYLPEYYYDKVEKTRDNIEDITQENVELKEDIKKKEDKIAALKKDIQDLSKKIESNEEMITSENKKLKDQKKDYKNIKERVTDMK